MSLVPSTSDGAPARREFGFDSLQREIDRVFDTFAHRFPVLGVRPAFPAMDVAESDEEIRITCELPGMEDKDVHVSLADGSLTIRGEKHAEKEEKNRSYHLVERSYGAFSRSVPMPSGVDPTGVAANMKNGVLKVTIAKPKSAVAKEIAIKSAG